MNDNAYVVGYIRVSTTAQEDYGVSLRAQQHKIREECQLRGWRLLRIEQDTMSGGRKDRPGLEQALAACRSGEAAGIIAARLDRLTRSVIDFASLMLDARKYNFNVVALDMGIDLSTPNGEFMANVLASIAQWERRTIGQRTKDALAVKREMGVQIGRRRLMKPELENEIRQALDAGKGLSSIATDLNRRGVKPVGGGKAWYPSTIRRVAQREA